MEINWYVVVGILTRIIVLAGIAIVVLPQQIHELRRPRSDMTVYRWLLLIASLGFIVFSVLPITYQAIRLDSPSEFSLLNLASMSGNLSIAVIAVPHIIFYILVKRSRKRKIEP